MIDSESYPIADLKHRQILNDAPLRLSVFEDMHQYFIKINHSLWKV